MKKAFSLILAASLLSLLYAGCKKNSGGQAPDPFVYNGELQSSKDACLAMLTVSDIDMCMSFVAEGELTPYFYMPAGQGGVVVTRDTFYKYLTVSFNNVLCKDGKTRDGTIAMNYSFSDPNAKYYRNYNFIARIALLNYKVDNWAVENMNTLTVANQRPAGAFNPANMQLSWRITGGIKMTHSIYNWQITWDGDVTKTLVNTNNPGVFKNEYTPIDWRPARVQYTGLVKGLAKGAPYIYTPDAAAPPLRDFTCTYSPVTAPSALLHPFTAGSAKIQVQNFHPRTVEYGPAGVCDNSGTIIFAGETHPVDFEP